MLLAAMLWLPAADAQAQGGGSEFLSATFTPVFLHLRIDGCRNGFDVAGEDKSCTLLDILDRRIFDYRGQTLWFAWIEYTHDEGQPGAARYLDVAFEPVRGGGTANIRLDDGLTLTIAGQSFTLDRQSAVGAGSSTTASRFRWPVSSRDLFRAGESVSLAMAFPRPGISVSPARPVVTEGEDAAFTLARTPDYAEALTEALEVSVAVTDEDGVLVSGAPSNVTIGAGAATATLRLATRDREGAQDDAAVALALQSGGAWTLGAPSEAVVTVRDGDTQEVTVAATPATVAHGEDAVFTLTRVGDRTAPLTVSATLTDGTRSPPPATPVSATFGAGAATATLRLATRDEEGAQADAAVVLALRDGAAYDTRAPSRATVAVRDEGRKPVTIADAAPVTEGGALAFAVTLTESSDTQVTVNYTLAGTAAAGTDYAGSATGVLTLAPGVTEGTIRVVTLDDGVDEPEETVRVQVVSVARTGSFELVSPGSIEAAGRILDDDLPVVTVAADAPAVVEGGDAAFTLTRAGDLSVALEVPVTVTDPGGVLAAAAPSSVAFGAGDAAAALRLGTVDDEVDESDAAVTLALGDGATWRPGAPSEATVTVRDNDGTPPEVSIADAGSVDEGGTLEFPISLSGPFHTRITVDYTLSGTAAAGEDHDGAASGAVTFAPGDTEKVVRLVTVDDGADEPEETVEVTLLAPDPSLATLGAVSRAAGRIWDGGLPRVRIAPVADVIVEGEDAEFIVTREGPLSEPLTFDYLVSEQSDAVARETSTFEAGKPAVRVSWPTQDDALFSVFSSVFDIDVRLLTGPYRLPGGNHAAVVVLEDDLPPVVSIADAGAVTEGGALAFPVTLSGPFSAQLTVGYRLGGTAAAGDHDGGASGAVTFAPGETEKTIRLVTVDDGAVEPEETVEVTLTAPDSRLATLGAATAAGRILDDDGAVEVTVSAVSERVVEGADAVFELARSGAVSGALDVSLNVADPGGALASAAPSGARFGAGETTTTLRLATRNVAGGTDAGVTVTLADGGAAWSPGTPSAATVTVRDDDTAPTVSIADAGDVVEGGVFAFPVTLDRPFNRQIYVTFGGTPTFNSGDWGEVPSEHVAWLRNRLYFDRGVTKRFLRIAAFQDGIDEADEPVTATLTYVSAGSLGRSTATGRILDSDRPLVKVGRVAGTVTEGEQAAFTFTRTGGDHSETLEVSFAVTDSGAVLAGAPPTGVTFGAGDATATLRLDTVDDTVDEADATLTLALRIGAEYGVRTPDRARVTVTDDDLPVVTVAAEAAAVTEGADAVFTLTRTEGELSQTLEVPVAVTDSGAVLAGAAPTSVTFGAGDATATLRLGTEDDAAAGPDTPVTLALQAGAGHALGEPPAATVTVRDDDAPPSVSVADAEPVTEGGALAFPVTLSAPFNAEITVDYRFGGSATAGEDYGAAASGAVTFAPRVTEQTIRLATTDDAAAESEEAVEVTLSLPVPDPGLAVLGTATASGRILDNDGPPQVTAAAASASVTEGADAVFTLTRANGDASGALTVAVAVTDAGAVLAGAPPAGVTFEAGSLTATLRLGTQDDDVGEDAAEVVLVLQPDPAYTLGDPSRAVVTVRDDDLPAVTVTAVADTVTEGEPLAFTLTRVGNLSEELAVLTGFGIAPDLFIDLQIATFAAGAATTRLDRTAPDVGADTTYVLGLSGGANYVLGEPSRASVTVRDDDAAPSVSIADADAVTEGGALEFPVTLSGPFHTEIEVDWRLGDGGTATAGDDHAGAVSGTVTFAPRVTAQTIRIATTDDTADEPEETVEVALSLPDPDPGLAVLGAAAATGRILDNDGPSQVTVAAVAAAVAEGADAVFTLTRANGDASGALTVPVAVTDAGAVLAGAAPPTGVTFEAGAATATLRLATDDDAADEADTPVTLTLQAGTDYSLGAPSTATVTVRDDDLPSVTVAADAPAVTEGEAAAFTLTRAGDLSVVLAVPVAVTDADGVLAEEAPISVTFSVDAATATLRLATDDDEADEPAAPVTLTLEAGPGHASGAPSTATVTVRDNDLPSVTVAADAATVTEGEAAAFTLTRAGDLTVPLEVSVLFGDADSVLLPGAPTGVTFEVDAATAALRAGTDDDDADEAAAAVTLMLQAGAGYVLGDTAAATVTVQDNDLPVVTVAAVSERIVEGESIRFTVTRTGDLSAALTVTTLFGTSPDTLALESQVTIGAGESTGQAGGQSAPDADADTAYWLGLKTSADYRPGEPALAMVTALDHDEPPEVSVADADAAPEGGALEFPVTLSRPFSAPLTVAYTLGGTAAAADYTDAAGGAVTFAKGEMQQTIRLAVVDDAADEAEEAVTVTLTDGDNYHLGTPAAATGRILDNDGPSQVTVAAVAAAVMEGADAAFTLTRAGDLSGAPEVSFTVEDAAGVLASPPPTGAAFEADASRRARDPGDRGRPGRRGGRRAGADPA